MFGFLADIFAFLVKLWRGAPDPKVREGEKLGTVSQALAQETASNAEVQKASDARAAVDPVVDDPGRLRRYESTDKNNRDNG